MYGHTGLLLALSLVASTAHSALFVFEPESLSIEARYSVTTLLFQGQISFGGGRPDAGMGDAGPDDSNAPEGPPNDDDETFEMPHFERALYSAIDALKNGQLVVAMESLGQAERLVGTPRERRTWLSAMGTLLLARWRESGKPMPSHDLESGRAALAAARESGQRRATEIPETCELVLVDAEAHQLQTGRAWWQGPPNGAVWAHISNQELVRSCGWLIEFGPTPYVAEALLIIGGAGQVEHPTFDQMVALLTAHHQVPEMAPVTRLNIDSEADAARAKRATAFIAKLRALESASGAAHDQALERLFQRKKSDGSSFGFSGWLVLAFIGAFFIYRRTHPLRLRRLLRKMPPNFYPVFPTEDETVPEPQRGLIDHGLRLLSAFGFERLGVLEGTPPDECRSWRAVSRRDTRAGEPAVLAVVATTAPLDLCAPIRVTLHTFFADGRVLQTAEAAYAWDPFSSTATYHFAGGPTALDARLAQHVAQVEDMGGMTLDLDLKQLADTFNALDHACSLRLVAEGQIEPDGDGFRWSAEGCRSLAQHLCAARAKNLPLWLTAEGHKDEPLAKVMTHALVTSTPKQPKGNSPLIFWASLAVFCVSFLDMLSWTDVGLLCAVLLFHEVGHLIAMKLSGYTNTRIFFVPFLGALTTGQIESAPRLGRQIFVSLAGPLPGLLLGVLALLIAPQWAKYGAGERLVEYLLLLNLFNLLPITPLDGGRLVDLMLASRRPLAGTIFRILSALAMVGLAVLLSSKLLGLIGVAIGWFALKRHRAEALAPTGERRPDESDFDAAWRISAAVATAPDDDTPFLSRLKIVRSLRTRLRAPKVSLPWAVGGIATYLLGLGATVAMTAVAYFGVEQADRLPSGSPTSIALSTRCHVAQSPDGACWIPNGLPPGSNLWVCCADPIGEPPNLEE